MVNISTLVDEAAKACKVFHLLNFHAVYKDIHWYLVFNSEHIFWLLATDDKANVTRKSADVVYKKLEILGASC